MKIKTFIAQNYRPLLLIAGILLLAGGIFMTQSMTQQQPSIHYQTQPIAKSGDLLKGSWQYMPGIVAEKDGLIIQPLDYSIVEQDGTVIQKNPPINLAGTHLEKVKGDFALIASLDLLQSTSATMQFYGNAPIIADEFKIERESLSVSVTKDKLIVKVWNGKTLGPIEVREFPFAASEKPQVKLTREQKRIYFIVNDKPVGEITDPGIFASGNIWFGLDALHKEWKLLSLRAEKIKKGSFVMANGASVQVDDTKMDSLKKLAQNKREGFIVGAAMALGPLTSDHAYAQVALTDFNSMTPENDMKMINLQPKRGVYTFAKADGLVHIAKQNGLSVHGHTLVFGEANPAWFTALPVQTIQEKQTIQNIMTAHIKTVVTHFGNDVASWDVVNEPLADYDEFAAEGEPRQGRESGQILRQHKWYEAMGESYIVTALETAHKANPEAQLFINEYGLEEDGARWEAMKNLLVRLKPQLEARGIPIQKVGIGFQSHIYEREDRVDANVLRTHIQQLEQLGYKAQISELDVFSGDGDRIQSDQYTEVFKACLEEKNCVAWRTWIISDRYNFWKNDDGQIYSGTDGLYDLAMQPRPARAALGRFLK